MKVLLTTVGKNANDEVVTEELTFNVVQATTTVAEALTLPVSDIVYLVEDAKVSNGFNTQYDRQIELVDSVDPSKKILVFEYGIQAIESYDYIAGGTITFKAKLSAYLGVNQFVQPEIIDYTDRVEEFASSIMTGDVEGQCVTRFDDYKIDVLAFTEIEMTKLEESSKEIIVNALARYQAWALHMGEKPFEAGKLSDNSSQYVNPSDSINSINATLIIGIIGLTTLAGYYFLQRKQKQS